MRTVKFSSRECASANAPGARPSRRGRTAAAGSQYYYWWPRKAGESQRSPRPLPSAGCTGCALRGAGGPPGLSRRVARCAVRGRPGPAPRLRPPAGSFRCSFNKTIPRCYGRQPSQPGQAARCITFVVQRAESAARRPGRAGASRGGRTDRPPYRVRQRGGDSDRGAACKRKAEERKMHAWRGPACKAVATSAAECGDATEEPRTA